MPGSAAEGRPLRVLQLLVSTAIGGGPKHVFDLVRRLPRDEFSVVVGAPADGPYFERFRTLGLPVVELALNRLWPWTLPQVVQLIRERGVQVIHSHGKGAGLYGRLAGRCAGVPAIHTHHGIHYDYPLGLGRLVVWAERFLSRLTHTVVHVSHSQAREAEQLRLSSPARSRVVVNGIDAFEVRALAEHAPISREDLGLSNDGQVLGCVARFDPVKGLDVLIEALRLLADRYPRLALVLIGGGKGERRLRKHVVRSGLKGRVHFTGPLIDASRVFPVLDLCVSASRREGLPLSLLEAMACSLPVVATAVPGHVDVVVDGMTGFLVPLDDSLKLAMRVARLLSDPELRGRMGQRGSERVETHFRLDSMTFQLAHIYRSAVEVS